MTHMPSNSTADTPASPHRTAREPFATALTSAWQRTDAFLCVGLDPSPDRLPGHLLADAAAARPGSPELTAAVAEFCRGIVDSTAALVCAYKPQIAHFAALGCEAVLMELIDYIHASYPSVPVILDAKRGDIGTTAQRYAIEAFERYDADAVTVNPWLGAEGLKPFFAYADRGTVVLCRTSNPDSAWLQTDPAGNDHPYLRIAREARQWNTAGNVLLVAGATYPEELGAIREAAGDDVALLVPGVGAQGGDLAAVFRQGADSRGFGLVVNSSRAIIYAGSGEDFAAQAAGAAQQVVDDMRELRRSANFIG